MLHDPKFHAFLIAAREQAGRCWGRRANRRGCGAHPRSKEPHPGRSEPPPILQRFRFRRRRCCNAGPFSSYSPGYELSRCRPGGNRSGQAQVCPDYGACPGGRRPLAFGGHDTRFCELGLHRFQVATCRTLLGCGYSLTLFFVHNGHALILGTAGCATCVIGLLLPEKKPDRRDSPLPEIAARLREPGASSPISSTSQTVPFAEKWRLVRSTSRSRSSSTFWPEYLPEISRVVPPE